MAYEKENLSGVLFLTDSEGALKIDTFQYTDKATGEKKTLSVLKGLGLDEHGVEKEASIIVNRGKSGVYFIPYKNNALEVRLKDKYVPKDKVENKVEEKVEDVPF